MELIQDQYDRGREDARRDADNGIHKVYEQVIGAWGQYRLELMRDRYGVFVKHVSDITNAGKLSYERGYNSITYEYIEQLGGAGTIQRIHEEVNAFRTERYRKYLKACVNELNAKD